MSSHNLHLRRRHLLDQLDHDDSSDNETSSLPSHYRADSDEIDASFSAVRPSLEELKKWWQNEKFAPELLPYRQQAVDTVKREMLKRSAELSMAHMEMKDISSNSGGGGGDGDDEHMKTSQNMETSMMQQMVYQLECHRVAYLLNSYLRTRLQKVGFFGYSAVARFYDNLLTLMCVYVL